MDQNENRTVLHEDKEVSTLTIDMAGAYVLVPYRGLAKNWWWDSLGIKAEVEDLPDKNNRYELYQLTDSQEYNPIMYPDKPRRLGYLEINNINSDQLKPINVRLVCSWTVVLSFWQQLDLILRRDFPVITTQISDMPDQVLILKQVMEKIYIPEQQANLAKWKFVWKKIRNWVENNEKIAEICRKIQADGILKQYITHRDTIRKIIIAGRNGMLDE
ncbi:MAG: hypothetical protein NTW32_26425 [Chloroflexi bacterium]|nr:hypothetical protein [Chloroflexota bacterium]